MSLATRVLAEIDRRGPIPFEEVVEAALYDSEGGFYATSGRAGRRGDFLTSPEVGPLFGVLVGRALDRWWHAMGEPDPYVVVEAGAGPGTLAVAVLAAQPDCAGALHYVLVERCAPQRALHAQRLALRPESGAGELVGPSARGARPARFPTGPAVLSLAEWPRLAGPCVVLANELLDNLPFGLAERGPNGWDEVLVGRAGASAVARPASAGGLAETLAPLAPAEAEQLDALAPGAPHGARAPRQLAAARWLREALGLAAPGGRVVVLDYGATTAELAARPWTSWVRTYRGHARGVHPLEALGAQDITCEVAIDQLAAVARPSALTRQAEWLGGLGLAELVDEGRRVWAERAGIGGLDALAARSRVGEGEALTDPAGLGAFCVLEWEV